MNILHVYAKKSLKRNPSRTAVTVIGIILSTAMLAAVTSMAASIQAYGIAYESAHFTLTCQSPIYADS